MAIGKFIKVGNGTEGFVLDEYKGQYYLTAAYQGREKIGLVWCYRDNNGEKAKKVTPMKIPLGTRDEAIVALKSALSQIIGKKVDKPTDDDAPF